MVKLAITGALIAALAAPAGASAQRARTAHQARAQALCPQSVVFLPGREYAICGRQFWVRDPQTGQLEQIRFWRLQHLRDRPDDRP